MKISILILLIILAAIFILPLFVKKVEQNLEVFLFFMGVLAAITSGILNPSFITGVLSDKYIYFIVLAVFLGGCLFKVSAEHIKAAIAAILKRVPLWLFAFFLVIVVGLLSSLITAIIAALFLVEIVNLLPLGRKSKIHLIIVSCFSIGIGAVLTPVGEPLATIVTSKLHAGFWYLFSQLGCLIIPGILLFGVLGALFVCRSHPNAAETSLQLKPETYKEILIRALKIFLFIISLELLGAGFKPVIDAYVLKLDAKYLFWLNMSSAILDNATLASAEISAKMTQVQITSILMGLLVSGGMMIPGNIPNIISAEKLNIKSKEWVKLGVPLGLIVMLGYFVILFCL